MWLLLLLLENSFHFPTITHIVRNRTVPPCMCVWGRERYLISALLNISLFEAVCVQSLSALLQINIWKWFCCLLDLVHLLFSGKRSGTKRRLRKFDDDYQLVGSTLYSLYLRSEMKLCIKKKKKRKKRSLLPLCLLLLHAFCGRRIATCGSLRISSCSVPYCNVVRVTWCSVFIQCEGLYMF